MWHATAWLVLAVLFGGCRSGGHVAPSTRPDSPLALVEATPDLDGVVVGRAPGANATLVVLFTSWCHHCKTELAIIERVRVAHPAARVLGLNYRAHEEYDRRGDAAAVRAYVTQHAPWLRVVPIDDALFAALGRPPKVPTLFVYDARGTLVARYDRRERRMPDAAELDALLANIARRELHSISR